MTTWLHIHRTEHIVHTSQFCRLSIDGGCPSGIVYLRKHEHPTLTRVHVVGQTIGFIGGDSDHTGGILFDGLTQLCLELRIGHSLMAQVDMS